MDIIPEKLTKEQMKIIEVNTDRDGEGWRIDARLLKETGLLKLFGIYDKLLAIWRNICQLKAEEWSDGWEKIGDEGEKTKVEVLKERLLYATGKYSDYSRYGSSLASIGEYDETLELYNMDIRLDNSEGTIRDKAPAMLRVTTELFYDLADNAARELYYVMREIVELDEDSQKKICGVVIPKDIFTEKEFREMLSEWYEYEYVQEDALQAYLEILKRWEWGK